jgi:hypothetical protein
MALKGTTEGPTFTAVVGAAAINGHTNGPLLVTYDTSGTIVACGVGGTAIGYVVDDYAIAATATVHSIFNPVCEGTASAAIAKGDFLKSAAAGQIAPEATVTTKTLNTIGQAATAASGAAVAFTWSPSL